MLWWMGIGKPIEWRADTTSPFLLHMPYMRFPISLAQAAVISLSVASAVGADWPQWRGPQRDGHAPAYASPTALPNELNPTWKINVHTGHASPIVAGGHVIFLDTEAGKEVVHALNAETGEERWKAAFDQVYEDEWGVGPRSTPFVDGQHLYVQSCRGEFQCRLLSDGKLIWRTNFSDFGVAFLGSKANEGTASRRGNNGSGVVVEDRVLVPVGSTNGATVVAFEKSSGKVLWKSLSDEAAYSSMVVGTLAGVRQAVVLTADALAGLAVDDGRVLWRVPLRTGAKRHALSPVINGDSVIVASHTLGMLSYKIAGSKKEQTASEEWSNRNVKINLSTPVLFEGHLYGMGGNKDFVCVNARTGELRWSQPGFGKGVESYASTIVAGTNLLVATREGQLLLVAADPARYRELGRLQISGNSWSHPALADGALYVKDERNLLRLDLGKK